MERKIKLSTPNAPSPAGPYSQGISSGNLVFVSGQRPVDPATGEMKEGIKAQTEQVLKNIESVLKEAGCTLSDVVKSTVYLSDISNFGDMNEVYKVMVPEPYPARSTFGVQLRGIMVEIDVIARKPKTETQ